MMLLSFLAFVSGTPRYVATQGVDRTPKVSVIWQHIVASARQCIKGKLALAGWCLLPVSFLTVLLSAFLYSFSQVSTILNWMAFGLTLLSSSLLIVAHLNNDYIEPLSLETDKPGAITVTDVKQALKTVPVMFAVNVAFNMGYNSQNNVYPAQACQMNTVVFGSQLNGQF